MSKLNNIDDLLKESFSNFSPEVPPGVWESVSSGLGNAATPAAGAAKAGKLISAIKQASVFTKIIMISLPLAAGIYGVSRLNENTVKPQAAAVQTSDIKNTEAEVKAAEPLVVTPEPAGTENFRQPETRIKSKENQKSYTAIAKVSTAEESIVKQETPSSPAAIAERKALENMVERAVEKILTQQQQPEATKVYPEKNEPVKTEQETRPETDIKTPEPTSKLEIPNTFTPNNDGRNDEFEIPLENETEYRLRILDKRNNLLFESNAKSIRWKGEDLRTGNPCPDGYYYYELEYRVTGQKEMKKRIGMIKLIR